MAEYKMIHIDLIDDPPIPARASIDETKLGDLMASLKDLGMIHPLVVVPYEAENAAAGEPSSGGGKGPSETVSAGDGVDGGRTVSANPPCTPAPSIRYRVVDGHRRLISARAISMTMLPCMVYPSHEIAEEAVKLATAIYREDLTAAEEGIFFAELVEKYDLTEDALCNMVHQKPDYIFERLQLVKGDPDILRACAERVISFAVAKELNRCSIAATRKTLLHTAIENGVSARVCRQWVNKAHEIGPSQPDGKPEAQPEAQPEAAKPQGQACIFCGRTDTPYHLEYGAMCFWEWDTLKQLIESHGIEVKGPWPKR